MRRKKMVSNVNVPLDAKLRQQIEKIATDREIAMSEVVREILSTAFENPQKVAI